MSYVHCVMQVFSKQYSKEFELKVVKNCKIVASNTNLKVILSKILLIIEASQQLSLNSENMHLADHVCYIRYSAILCRSLYL